MKVDSTLPTSSSTRPTNLRTVDQMTKYEKRSKTWKKDMGSERKFVKLT